VIYVDDVTDAVRRALFSAKPLSRAYNIALDKAYGNEELEGAIRRALPELSFEIGNHPNAATIGHHRDRDVLDISLAKKDLGWTPKIDLYDGITRLVEWLIKHKSKLG
jgi:nucleoside-diphosphate-sugar epimerase